MNKISDIRYVFFILLFQLSAFSALSVDVKMNAPEVVRMGQRFKLVVTVNAKPSAFNPPGLNDFTILSGPSTQSSFSTRIVNGKMTQSYTVSYTYVLRPTKVGKFNISPATIKHKGKTYQSNDFNIEVLKSKSSQGSKPGGQQSQKSSTDAQEYKGEDMFVRVILSDRNVYRGEYLIATIKIYTKLDIVDLKVEYPNYNGFFQQEIKLNNANTKKENVNGEIYLTKPLQQVILFPQKEGEITIDPIEMECVIRKAVSSRRQGFFNGFFGQSYKHVKRTIKSKPVTVHVKSLPTGEPQSFKGAVGELSMNVEVDKKKLTANNPVSFKIRISGNGNIKLIESPKIDFPPDFEVYDPETNVSVNNTYSGSAGHKTFEYLAIPRHAGNFRIPPVEFTYFDISQQRYKTIQSQEFNIQVEEGEQPASSAVVGSVNKEDIQYIGKDIRFIHHNINLKNKGDTIAGSSLFYLVYILSGLFFIVFIIIKRKQIKERADYLRIKNKKANKQARRRLKTALKHMKEDEKETFYEEIVKALWGYLSDKLMIPVSGLSMESASSALQKNNIEDPVIKRLEDIIDNCEFARYAPSSETKDMETIYNDAASIITELDKKLKI